MGFFFTLNLKISLYFKQIVKNKTDLMPEVFHPDFVFQSIQSSFLKKGTTAFVSVSTDSRQKLKEHLFVALQGKHFDGHDFLNQALDQGASGFILSNKNKAKALLKKKNLSVFYVPDTLKALHKLARAWTKTMDTKVMAITGSNGENHKQAFCSNPAVSFGTFCQPQKLQ